MDSLLENVFDAHGGYQNWKNIHAITAELRFGGLAFLLKLNRKGRRKRTIWINTQTQQVVFNDFPRIGYKGFYTPGLVWIEDDKGRKIKVRNNPRNYFSSFRRIFYWDNMDLLYFSGYAIWNYLNAPFYFSREGVQFKALGPHIENGEIWNKAEVIFPESLTTHCKKQVFYFDAGYKLRRLDYDPEVFASWAKAAQFCFDYQMVENILIPVKRRVVPRTTSGKSKPWPVLVWIELNHISFS